MQATLTPALYTYHTYLKDIATTLADMQTTLIATSFMVDDSQANVLLDKLDEIFAELELTKNRGESMTVALFKTLGVSF